MNATGNFELKELLYLGIILAPLVLVYLAGFIWALTTWARHPRVSLLAALGMGLMTLLTVVWPFVRMMLLNWWFSRSTSNGSFESTLVVHQVLGFVHSVVYAGLMVLVLFAIFSSRRSSEMRWPEADQQPAEHPVARPPADAFQERRPS